MSRDAVANLLFKGILPNQPPLSLSLSILFSIPFSLSSSTINGLCRRRNAASAALKNIPSKAEAAAKALQRFKMIMAVAAVPSLGRASDREREREREREPVVC